MAHARVVVLLAAQSLLVAGCGGGSAPPTSLFGSSQPIATAAVTPAPNDPMSRAVQVGATSARAARCSFNFDPNKLKAKYLASETAQGANADQMNKIERAYEYSRSSVAQTISAQPDYCSDYQSKIIKDDLARHMAGDFTPPAKTAAAQSGGGIFGNLFEGSATKKPWTGTFDDQTGEVQ